MRSLIIGMGEIGQGLYKATRSYHQTFTYDPKTDTCFPKITKLDILHICIPGGLNCFEQVVVNYIKCYTPKVTVIHSTVPVGTTWQISLQVKRAKVVHSPVRGMHPDMEVGIKTYVKYIGYDDLKAAKLVCKFYEKAKIAHKIIKDSKSTELAKLFCTTKYGISIAFTQIQKELCDSMCLDFDKVVTDWDKTYNAGLKTLNLGQYTRPILSAPGRKIGGHCVVENAKLLTEMYPENMQWTIGSTEHIFEKFLNAIILVGKGDRQW